MKEDVVEFRLDILCAQYKDEIIGMTLAQQLRFAVLLLDTMPKWTNDPVEQEYRSAYIISGVEAIERVWVERGFAESIDEVVAIVQRAHERQVPVE